MCAKSFDPFGPPASHSLALASKFQQACKLGNDAFHLHKRKEMVKLCLCLVKNPGGNIDLPWLEGFLMSFLWSMYIHKSMVSGSEYRLTRKSEAHLEPTGTP